MRIVRGALVGAAGVALSLGVFASAAVADPPGNNGTVKIDAEEFDTHPDNEPHVGCVFEVDFYGFDQGDLNADVQFVVHPPTGKDTVLLTDTVEFTKDFGSYRFDPDGTFVSEKLVDDILVEE